MRRLLLAAAVALALAVAAPAGAQERTPAARIRGEVAALASAVATAAGGEVAFVSTASSLNFIRGHAWILTLAVEDAPAYGGTYFILSDVNGRLTGELLHAPGPDGTRVLTDDALARYLERVELDAAPIRTLFERYYRRRQ